MAARVRMDVYSPTLPRDHLTWYGRAVAKMKSRQFSDPTSWSFQAAVHGYFNGGPWPALVSPPQRNRLWQQCQHQTWFFLPWHRGYLTCFEAIVAKTVRELGGPADWALPYWNYSSGGANARKLPRAFLGRDTGGRPNPLWSPRRPQFDQNPDYQVPAGITNTGPALAVRFFAGRSDGGSPGFGGPQTDFMHYGGQLNLPSGALESQPHNLIHDALGGLMGNPDTAALDPIFWLHHCNIDRLWQVWLNRQGGRANPDVARWLTGTRFRLHDQNGRPYDFTSSQMTDTRRVLHGFVYDDPDARPIEEAIEEGVEMAPAEPPPARLVGASGTGISLESGRAAATVELGPELESMAALESAEAEPPRAFLNVENVTGVGRSAIYRVLVKPVAQDGSELEPVEAGYISTFGAGGAPGADDTEHPRSGQTVVLDVTDILAGLEQAGHGAPRSLEVIFEEELAPEEGEEGALESVASTEPIKVGRVSLYLG